MPILDETSPEALTRIGRKRFRIDITNRQEGLLALMRGSDPWLKACAIYASGTVNSTDLQDLIEEASGSSNLLVRETAQLVAKTWRMPKRLFHDKGILLQLSISVYFVGFVG